MKKFSIAEVGILIMFVVCIFISEYHYIVEGNANKAIFIGLWPPTILGLMNYINFKRNK